MPAGLKEVRRLPPTPPPGELPARIRILFITGPHRTGGWLAQAFAADSAAEVELEEVSGVTAGLSRLREEVFDAVLVSHEAESLDALELLDAVRAASCDEQPVIVLGEQSEQEMTAVCYEAGGDAYVCVNTTTTRTLIWTVARAMERRRLAAENRRLRQAQRHRLQLEHEEAARLLEQQRAMIQDLERLRGDANRTLAAQPSLRLPAPLVNHYRELLRAYVIMGSGNLGAEMTRLAELLASAAVTAQQAMMLHLQVLEEMIRGLGSRSARHVMSRADMLILEVMINLAEDYRERFLRRADPPRQLRLPGMEDLPAPAF